MAIEAGSIIAADGMEWVVVAVTPTHVVARSFCGRVLRVAETRDETGLDMCQGYELPLVA